MKLNFKKWLQESCVKSKKVDDQTKRIDLGKKAQGREAIIKSRVYT
jgi:hypothetical protein